MTTPLFIYIYSDAYFFLILPPLSLSSRFFLYSFMQIYAFNASSWRHSWTLLLVLFSISLAISSSSADMISDASSPMDAAGGLSDEDMASPNDQDLDLPPDIAMDGHDDPISQPCK